MISTRKIVAAGALSSLIWLGLQANAHPVLIEQSVSRGLIFAGACDGSAAVTIGSGTLLAANDETNELASYGTLDGTPIAVRSVNDLLGFRGQDEIKEIDIEAAVTHGDQIWWIGSHGRNNKEELRIFRRSLFATNIPQPDLSDLEIVNQRTDILSVLIGSDMTSGFFTDYAMDAEPKEGGVNIEAMAFDPAGNLILGFRAPLSAANGMSGDALLVRLAPAQMGFQVAQVQELDLNDRGFRDIVAVDGSFLIIAGPVSNNGSSSVYRWDGENDLVEVNLDGLNDFNAEALVVIDDELFVISDDGRVEREDDAQAGTTDSCKDILEDSDQGNEHPSVFFRAQVFSFE